MRKKIFIIHGKGVKNGLFKEGGGDLDTVVSNVFYKVWADNTIKGSADGEKLYGKAYDFDFVNYQEGLGHLIVHKGADIYLPDFPIDALAKRVKLKRFSCSEELHYYSNLCEKFKNLVELVVTNSQYLNVVSKTIFTEFHSKFQSYVNKLSCEYYRVLLNFVEFYRKIFQLEIKGEQELVDYCESLIMGEKFEDFKNELLNFYEKFNAFNKKISDTSFSENLKSLFAKVRRGFFMFKICDDFFTTYIEHFILLKEGLNFIAQIDNAEVKHNLKLIFKELSEFVREFLTEFKNNLNKELSLTFEEIIDLKSIKFQKEDYKFIVRLEEVATLKPVSDAKIYFKNLTRSAIFLSDGEKILGNNEFCINTGKAGEAILKIKTDTNLKSLNVCATADDIEYIFFNEENRYSPDSSTVKVKNKALSLACFLIEQDIKNLFKNDVKLIRIDDHHPYTEEIYDTLIKLKEQGLIQEINLSSLPRGQEQPIPEQKCGTDLIYEEFIKGKSFDNEGIRELRKLAHVQDLHITSDPLFESKHLAYLNKLIGSGYSKIDMVLKLSEVKTKEDVVNFFEITGLKTKVDEFEKGQQEILPRVLMNLVALRIVDKEKMQQGSLPFLARLKSIFMRNKNRKENYLNQLLAFSDKAGFDVFITLAPFVDVKRGETKINVASIINYLKYLKQPDKTAKTASSFVQRAVKWFREKFGIVFKKIFSDNGKEFKKRRRYYSFEVMVRRFGIKHCYTRVRHHINMDYFMYAYGSSLMTMRKVAERELPVDLSLFAQVCGTKADGGHAQAATCKPVSNPSFPEQLSKVNDWSFPLFADYIGKIIADFTGLEYYGLRFPYNEELFKEYENLFEQLTRNLFMVTLKKQDNEIKILAALSVKEDEYKRKITPVIATNFLNKFFDFDILMFIQGSFRVTLIRNSKILSFDELYRFFAPSQAEIAQNAILIEPRKLKDFPVTKFRWIDDKNMLNYLYYMSTLISRAYAAEILEVREEAPIRLDKKLITVMPKFASNIYAVYFGMKKDVPLLKRIFFPNSLYERMIVTLMPFIERPVERKPTFTEVSIYFTRLFKMDYFVLVDGSYNIYIRKFNMSSQTLDIGKLAHEIGGNAVKSGFSSAIIKPMESDVFPKEKFERINYKNFKDFINYLCEKITEVTGKEVAGFERV